MTLFANLRGSAYGAVCEPHLIDGDPFAADPPAMRVLQWPEVEPHCAGRDVVLVAHGFNVSYISGLRSLARLEPLLQLGPNGLFLGVLWPGDWVVPAINYPFAIGVARQAGAKLGAFCNRWLKKARSLRFVSHSLGARVILEAVSALDRRPQMLCVTAGAVNDDCLVKEYRAAAGDADLVQTLSSHDDHVLRLAYPVGDVIGEILHDDHTLFRRALGLNGPTTPWPTNVQPQEISAAGFGHGDYLPPDALRLPPGAAGAPAPWQESAAFMRRALQGLPVSWP